LSNQVPAEPWNPAVPVQVSPEEYEQQAVQWLRSTGASIESFGVNHQERIGGPGGEYSFDAVVTLTMLRGARIIVLVECKRHKNPVKREYVLALDSKLRDVGAHKAIMFSTAGFQRGALEYASQRGIATVTFIDGKLTYQTRSARPPAEPPAWLDLPRFAGWFDSQEGGATSRSLLLEDRPDPLAHWLG